MSTFVKVLIILAAVVAALIAIGWLGLRVQPKLFAPVDLTPGSICTIPVPDGLPAPVQRFYAKVYGTEIPVIESAVISGRAQIRPAGPFYMPSRFRFSHISGHSYRHYIEVTFFNIPFMRVNERYVNGETLFETPFGTTGDDPKSRQGANLGLWAETIWTPSVFLTDPRVQWDAIDDETALLTVPFEDGSERIVVRFDPQTDLITFFESMRYHNAESTAKVLWINENREWGDMNGQLGLRVGAITWMDNGTPWAIFTVEDIQYNSDVNDYIIQKGP